MQDLVIVDFSGWEENAVEKKQVMNSALLMMQELWVREQHLLL